MLSYLKKMRSELKEEKMKLEAEMNQIQNELNRNQKFLQSLKEEQDQNFDLFSPRRKNIRMYDNIQILEQEQTELSERLEKLQSEFFQINSRLEETDNLIKEIRKRNIEKSKNENKEQQLACSNLDKNIKSLIQKTDFCIQILRVDPNRCKIELSHMKNILQEMQKKLFNDSDSGQARG